MNVTFDGFMYGSNQDMAAWRNESHVLYDSRKFDRNPDENAAVRRYTEMCKALFRSAIETGLSGGKQIEIPMRVVEVLESSIKVNAICSSLIH